MNTVILRFYAGLELEGHSPSNIPPPSLRTERESEGEVRRPKSHLQWGIENIGLSWLGERIGNAEIRLGPNIRRCL